MERREATRSIVEGLENLTKERVTESVRSEKVKREAIDRMIKAADLSIKSMARLSDEVGDISNHYGAIDVTKVMLEKCKGLRLYCVGINQIIDDTEKAFRE